MNKTSAIKDGRGGIATENNNEKMILASSMERADLNP